MAPVVDLYREMRLTVSWEQFWFNRIALIIGVLIFVCIVTRKKISAKDKWRTSQLD
jgi:hypothetical protein